MKITEQSYEIISPVGPEGLINECKKIEQAGRLCYKSEDKIMDDSWKKFVKMLREHNHGAMLEHSSMSVKFTTDRGVLAEFTRHRLASYAVESTRYCNYSKGKFGGEITVINPFTSFDMIDREPFDTWKTAMENSEKSYLDLINHGAAPELARSVLPQSLKCEMVVTANFREWLHLIKLRTAPDAHPQIRDLLVPLYVYLNQTIPQMFSV